MPGGRKIHKIPLAQRGEMVYTRIAQQSRNDGTAQAFVLQSGKMTAGRRSFPPSRAAGSERYAREEKSGI